MMADTASHVSFLPPILTFCGAAVVAVPLFRLLGLSACASLIGFSTDASVVTGMALALSSTAIGLQMLDERNDIQAPYGERSFAVLLFQDLSVVPILAILPVLAGGGAALESGSIADRLIHFFTAIAAIAAVILVGRYGLNPFFRVLAR